MDKNSQVKMIICNYCLDGGEENVPKYYLQVGDWFYPLVPEVSPCFRSDFGAFILPDLHSSVEGNCFCCHSSVQIYKSIIKFVLFL